MSNKKVLRTCGKEQWYHIEKTFDTSVSPQPYHVLRKLERNREAILQRAGRHFTLYSPS